MLNFREYLQEVFDRAVPYRVLKHTKERQGFIFNVVEVEYTFEIDNRNFLVRVQYKEPINADVKTYHTPTLRVDFSMNKQVSLSNLNKDQFKVYSTVFAIIKQFINENKLQYPCVFFIEGFTERQNQLYYIILQYMVKRGLLYSENGTEFFIKHAVEST